MAPKHTHTSYYYITNMTWMAMPKLQLFCYMNKIIKCIHHVSNVKHAPQSVMFPVLRLTHTHLDRLINLAVTAGASYRSVLFFLSNKK